MLDVLGYIFAAFSHHDTSFSAKQSIINGVTNPAASQHSSHSRSELAWNNLELRRERLSLTLINTS